MNKKSRSVTEGYYLYREGRCVGILIVERGVTTMELMEVILSKENLNRAYKKVVTNKGASGIDEVTVEELGNYIRENREVIINSLRNRTYFPKPVRRVYIPKTNGRMRPLGIPTALDRTIQQAVAQPISDIYEKIFSEYSYGFRQTEVVMMQSDRH